MRVYKTRQNTRVSMLSTHKQIGDELSEFSAAIAGSDYGLREQ